MQPSPSLVAYPLFSSHQIALYEFELYLAEGEDEQTATNTHVQDEAVRDDAAQHDANTAHQAGHDEQGPA